MRTPRSRYFALAHQYVTTAIYHGDLPKLDGSVLCVDCQGPAEEYDHRDYKKPMEVEPVCRVCNAARGPGLHRDPSETADKPLTMRQKFEQGFRGGDWRAAKRKAALGPAPAPKGEAAA